MNLCGLVKERLIIMNKWREILTKEKAENLILSRIDG